MNIDEKQLIDIVTTGLWIQGKSNHPTTIRWKAIQRVFPELQSIELWYDYEETIWRLEWCTQYLEYNSDTKTVAIAKLTTWLKEWLEESK